MFQGFEAVKQLLEQSQAYKVILGARNIKATQDAYDGLTFNRDSNSVSILPLELADLKGVKTFAETTLEKLGQTKIDYLLLNAAISKGAEEPGPNGSKWCESYIVNSLCKCSSPTNPAQLRLMGFGNQLSTISYTFFEISSSSQSRAS